MRWQNEAMKPDLSDAESAARRIAAEATPCDDCGLYDLCAKQRMACEAFSVYTAGQPFQSRPRIPTQLWAVAIFTEDKGLKAQARNALKKIA